MTDGPHYGRRASDHDSEFLRQRIGLASARIHSQSEISHRFKVITTVTLTVLSVYLALSLFGPWSAYDTVRHMAAFPGCGAARFVGLPLAWRGQPGYWAGHDSNHDGVACGPGDRGGIT